MKNKVPVIGINRGTCGFISILQYLISCLIVESPIWFFIYMPVADPDPGFKIFRIRDLLSLTSLNHKAQKKFLFFIPLVI
jgi:hypothetical protein